MRQLITLLILTIWTVSSLACDCFWEGDFFTAGMKKELIVRVKIIDHQKGDPEVQQINEGVNERMRVEVIKVYKGEETRDTITVWGDNGGLCRPYVNYFKDGQEYFLALSKLPNRDEYYLSNCGEFYLTIKGGKVHSETGVRKELPQIQEMNLDEFEKKLKKTPANKR